MPPELTSSKLKRKASHREVDEYKNFGQVSCAECRRLKIKCDGESPCQSCQGRGRAPLCTNRSSTRNSTSGGGRFVLAGTEHLHHRIAKLNERIRQLEDALAELQSQLSTEPHPLLCEDVVGVTHKDNESRTSTDELEAAGHPPEVLDAFGTLSISDHGISRFFGPTGGSECLLMSESATQLDRTACSTPDTTGYAEVLPLPQELRMFSQAFPFTLLGSTYAVRELIEAHLPNWERAVYLSQTYCEHAGWLYHGVAREQIMEELLPLYYPNGPHTATNVNQSGHELALLFLVFAMGALVDLEQDPGNAEAEHYHHIARAAICLQPVLEKPSLVTIQALYMLSIYNSMDENEMAKETSMETTWSLNVLAAHLSQTAGLHRDSTRWGLPDNIVQRRRSLFWSIFIQDAWHSLSTGRPPSFTLAYIDCQYPRFVNKVDKPETDLQVTFELWNYRFASECVATIAARTLTAEKPSYKTIMELDRKVCRFPLPDDVKPVTSSASSPVPTSPAHELSTPVSMSHFIMAHAREVILLHIHRGFFAQAIIENPVNPLKSQYAPSFLAAYRASLTILHTIGAQYALYPQLCARFWSIWTFVFSSAIVFGTIVTRGPRSPLALSAAKELDTACALLTTAAPHSRRAAKALPIVRKLSEKAHNALAASQNELGQQLSVKEEVDDDELAIFAGRTRFVSTARPPESARASDGVRLSLPGLPEPSAAPLQNSAPFEDWGIFEGGPLDDPAWSTPAAYTHTAVASVLSQSQPHHAHAESHILAGQAQATIVTTSSAVTAEHYARTTSTSAQFASTNYSASADMQGLVNAYQPPPSLQTQFAPSEWAELGLVSQESQLDEWWTSFMRDLEGSDNNIEIQRHG